MRRSLLVLLAGILAASVVSSAIGICGTVYTWEKTFEVTKPEIMCEIEVGDKRIVGCQVNVWVHLSLADCQEDCCCNNWKDDCENCKDCWKNLKNNCKNCWKNWKDNCANCVDDWEDDCDDDDDYEDCWECGCYVNGTYSAHLYWYNESSEEWQHVKHLQEEINTTLTCYKHVWPYMFIPMWEGQYKVVVMFAMDSEICTFSNED